MTGRQYSDDELRDAFSTMVALVRAWNSSPDPETETGEIRVLLDNCDLRTVTKTLVGAFRDLMMQFARLTGAEDRPRPSRSS